MKTLTKLALALVLFATAAAAHAQTVRGHFRSNGSYVAPYYRSSGGSLGSSSGYASPSRDYVYRNPYAAYPSVGVQSYFKSDGTYVLPHYRTPANDTITDNFNYRGNGTIRVPRYSSGW